MPKKHQYRVTFKEQSLGLCVADREDGKVGVEVDSVLENSEVYGKNTVAHGDVILKVGVHDIHALHYDDFVNYVKAESERPLVITFFRPYSQKYEAGIHVNIDNAESDDDEDLFEKAEILSFDEFKGVYKVRFEDGDVEKVVEKEIHTLPVQRKPAVVEKSEPELDLSSDDSDSTDSASGAPDIEKKEEKQPRKYTIEMPTESSKLAEASEDEDTSSSGDEMEQKVIDIRDNAEDEATAQLVQESASDDEDDAKPLMLVQRSANGSGGGDETAALLAQPTLQKDVHVLQIQYNSLQSEVEQLKRVCSLFGEFVSQHQAGRSGEVSNSDQGDVQSENTSTSQYFAVSKSSVNSGNNAESKQLVLRDKKKPKKKQRKKRKPIKPVDPKALNFGPHGLVQRGKQGTSGLFCSDRLSVGLCLLNILMTPFLLIIHSLRIYVFPCLWVYVFRCCCWGANRIFGSCILYKDSEFPADASSLGEYEAKGQAVFWVRGNDILAPLEDVNGDGKIEANERKGGHAHLFQDGVTPSDICQGMLGDCWLLSAIACMAEFPGLIENLFSEKVFSHRGKYTIRLFNPSVNDFVHVTIDDRFPCTSKENPTPMFTKPNPRGGELWTMLLEKAFAKLCGSYGSLEGGYSLWGLHVMTGDPVVKWHRDNKAKQWEPFELRIDEEKEGTDSCSFFSHSQLQKENDSIFFKLLLKYDHSQCILSAGSHGVDNTRKEGRPEDKDGGIVPGHAYSIIKVRQIGRHRLLCLRNPWGKFEWKGDWSDHSPLWDKEIKVRLLLRPDRKNDDDGIFWMSFEDFLKYFDGVDVCFRTTGMSDLSLHVHEEYGNCGPLLGCILGLITYWVCCCGLFKLWCARGSDVKIGQSAVHTGKGGVHHDLEKGHVTGGHGALKKKKKKGNK
eukprot:g4352.t1